MVTSYYEGPSVSPGVVDSGLAWDSGDNLFKSEFTNKFNKGELGSGSMHKTPFRNTVNYPEYQKKKIFESFDYLSSSVSRTIEVSAGIIWDTYQKWLQFKNMDPIKYKEEMDAHRKELESRGEWFPTDNRIFVTEKNQKEYYDSLNTEGVIDVSDDSKFQFNDFCDSFIQNDKLYGDPQCVLNYDGYIRSVAMLRNELANVKIDGITELIKFDIENSPDFAAMHINRYSSKKIVFKIKPILKGIEKLMDGSDTTVPYASYKVCFDIRNLIFFLIRNVNIEGQEYLDKDSYIADVQAKMNEIPALVARNICFEMLDNSINIQNNFNTFLKKMARGSVKIYNDPDFVRQESLINGLLKKVANGNDALQFEIRNKAANLDIEQFNNILTKISENPNWENAFDNDPINFTNRIMNSVYGETKHDVFTSIVEVLFIRAFSIFFESVAGFDYQDWFLSPTFSRRRIIFIREFDKDYDFTTINSAIAGIGDYNVKDFFRDISSTMQKARLESYDYKKLKNGEKCSYMFAKLKRKTWINMTCYFNTLFNLYEKYESVLADAKKLISTNLDSGGIVKRICEDIESYLHKRIMQGFIALADIANQTGVPLWKTRWTPSTQNIFMCNDLRDCIRYLTEYLGIVDVKYTLGHHKMHGRIKKWMKDQSSLEIKYDDEYSVMSFDSLDLSNNLAQYTTMNCGDIIRDNLRAILVDRGILDVSFSPGS